MTDSDSSTSLEGTTDLGVGGVTVLLGRAAAKARLGLSFEDARHQLALPVAAEYGVYGSVVVEVVEQLLSQIFSNLSRTDCNHK